MTTIANVRLVDANRGHVPFVAWVVMTANRSHMPRGMWDMILGDDEALVLRYLEAMADADVLSQNHHSLFLIAEVDGVPAAGLCGFVESDFGPASLMQAASSAYQELGLAPELFAAGWRRAKSVTEMALPHEPGAWVVEHVATHPDYRRRGLIDLLMAKMLERGRQRGAITADIALFIGNDAAQRAYEKYGFVAVDESRNESFEVAYGSPGVRRLRRSLGRG